MQFELNNDVLNAITQLGDLALRQAGAQAVPLYNLVMNTLQAQVQEQAKQQPANAEKDKA